MPKNRASSTNGRTDHTGCEGILLSSGLIYEAYRPHQIKAVTSTTHLATFRAIARKYPHKAPEYILRDLAANQPGAEGKWFAAAKNAGLYDFAIELVRYSPTDPRNLTRAARDYHAQRPDFAFAAGFATLTWMARGHGHDITALDVWNAFDALLQAAPGTGLTPTQRNRFVP